uniref:Cilia- and flagella-associated protein 58 central coiled coil domain-containing protein n=1 Tax=Globisporangium ultimum (strain ATCC 200006 / CBS 805.95 / DAOM BR144) TaxID=431595 RepID=K3WJT3_GLOUD
MSKLDTHDALPNDTKLLDDPSLEGASLETLENDFQEVLAELAGDKSLERFRLEYEKLHRALKKSNGQEKKLIKKCRELNAEIINNAAKVQTALKLSQEDQASIASLKKEMEKAWKMVDASHEKEIRAKETIQQLKDEINNLSRLVEQGAGLSVGQENMLKEVMRAKEELARSNEEHEANAKKDHDRIQELHKRLNDMEQNANTQKNEIQALKDQLAMKAAEQERELRRKERLDKEIKDVKGKLEKKTQEQAQCTTDLTKAQTMAQTLEKQLTESRGTMDKYVRDYEALFSRTQKLTDLLNEQNDKTMQLEVERRNLENGLKLKQDEVNRMRLEKTMAERKIDKEKRNIQKLEEKLEDEHTAKLVLQTQIKSLQRDLDNDKINEDHQKTEIEALEREKTMQLKNVQKSEAKVRKAQDEIKTNERVAKNLEQELAGFKQEAAKQRKLIYQLEKEREKYGMEASEQRKLYLQSEEEVKLKEMRIHEMQKKVNEGENKLKQQQQLYEAVRSERNLYSKNLIESQDEIAEMKRKFKIMNHQIEQLKEEVSAKDVALVKEHFDHQKVEKQKEQHKNELARLRTLLATNEETINNQDAEIRKLTTMIRRMDDEALEQRKEYDQVINERDILGTQLIRRNDELALLYEKLKIQQSTLSKGEAQYQERMQDIRVLKLKITDLKRELYIAKHQVGQSDELKREVYHLQRELLQEKTKVKALSEELENPMNVHRWRKLEGSDPATYELLQKIQTLQKRLIQKTEEVVEKDLVNQEKEKLYQELKTILARQPGPEVAEQLSWYQQVVREKEKQLKSLLSEQNMFQSKENELKFEIERLARELHEFKRKYYKKKLEEKMKDKNPVVVTRQPPLPQGAAPGAPSQYQLPNLSGSNNSSSNGMSKSGAGSRSNPTEAQRQLAIASSNRFVGGGFSLNQ